MKKLLDNHRFYVVLLLCFLLMAIVILRSNIKFQTTATFGIDLSPRPYFVEAPEKTKAFLPEKA